MLKLDSLRSAALTSLTAVAITLSIPPLGGADAAAGAKKLADAIEGVWESTVTAKDCATGAVLFPPFKVLIVFRRGGTFDVAGAENPVMSSAIYGVWKRSTGTAYTAGAVHQRLNPDGSYAGNNKIQRSLTLSPDGGSFKSTLAVQILDLNGNVLGQSCPTEEAVRMSL
jgi:hypothetical protein